MTDRVVVNRKDGKSLIFSDVESIGIQAGRKRFNLPMKDAPMLEEFYRKKGGV